MTTGPALAQSDDRRIDTLQAQIRLLESSTQAQIRSLHAELTRVRRELAAKTAAVRTVDGNAAKPLVASGQAQTTVVNPGVAINPNPGNRPPGVPTFGLYEGHPDYPSPKSDWTSLNANPRTAADQEAGATGHKGEFHVGGLTIQLGGWIQGDAVYRTRNQVTDLGSSFNGGIPLPQSQRYNEGEFRASARGSRFSMLLHGDVNSQQHVAAYAEFDLQGAAATANSNESNSYNPRMRQAFASYDNDAIGMHVLVGQSSTLATMHRVGVTPLQAFVPVTIEQNYVPGFTWARQPQILVAKDFGGKYWLAASLENPQTVYSVGPNGTGVVAGTANYDNPGIPTLTPGEPYSTEIAPDVIFKVAADPGYGHYEAYGIGRFMQDRVSVLGRGHGNTRLAGGLGGGMIVPILGEKLLAGGEASAGYGLGRYGAVQLPDATINRDGSPAPLPIVRALVGLASHPTPKIDLYGYVGFEGVGRKTFNVGGKGYGYGNPLYSNAGCQVELSTAPCTANTSSVVQGTVVGYWRLLTGDFGTVQAGMQYSYTRRNIYKGATGPGGTGNASTDENTLLFNLRYLPFQ